MALNPVVFLPRTHDPNIIRIKTTNPTERQTRKYLTSTLQNFEGHQKQGTSQKLSQLR